MCDIYGRSIPVVCGVYLVLALIAEADSVYAFWAGRLISWPGRRTGDGMGMIIGVRIAAFEAALHS